MSESLPLFRCMMGEMKQPVYLAHNHQDDKRLAGKDTTFRLSRSRPARLRLGLLSRRHLITPRQPLHLIKCQNGLRTQRIVARLSDFEGTGNSH
jgi:hypothetical protein